MRKKYDKIMTVYVYGRFYVTMYLAYNFGGMKIVNHKWASSVAPL